MNAKNKNIFVIAFVLFITAFSFLVRSQAQAEGTLVDVYLRELTTRLNADAPYIKKWLMPADGDDLQSLEQIEASNLYQPYVIYSSGAWDSAVGIGDFNNDGLNDVGITDNGILRVFLQNASGTLDTPVIYHTGSRPETLAVGDLNNDQRDDIVVGNFSDNTIGVFLQQVDGTLASQVTYGTSTGPDAVAVADLNNDGLMDVVVSHWNASNIGVFLQQPNGTLGSRISYPAPQAGYDDIDTGDLNNDGLMDVVKMNGQLYANPNLSVYLQNACGTLSQPISYDLPGNVLSHGVATGDLTDDGFIDLALSHGGNRPSSMLSVFTQTLSGSLQLAASYNAYDIPEPVEIADVNMDGLRDVVVAHGGWNQVGIFLQQPDGTLAPYLLDSIPYASHYKPQGLDVGDINNDLLPDIVIADYNYGLVVLYHVSGSSYPTPTPITPFTPIPCSSYTPTATHTSTPTPSSTPTPTSSSTPTATQIFTPNPSSSSTPIPSSTPTATYTLTPTNVPGCVPTEGPLLYWNDFEDGAGEEWSNRSLGISPTGRKFLGQFNNNNIRLTLSCLPPHEMLRIAFDLFMIRSWDGNVITSGESTVGPDLWSFGVSNDPVLVTTFSNWIGGYQAYPMAYPRGNMLAFTGASEINTLGFEYGDIPMDSVYHMSFLVPHKIDFLVIEFSALGLQSLSDESWGLDNINVSIADLNKVIYLPTVKR